MKTSNLQIVLVVRVLVICSQIMASNNLIERNSFVVDCSQSTGKIVYVRFNNENIWSSVVIEDAEFFDCVPEGYFVYRNKGGDWHTGNITSPDTISKIDTSVIPQDVIYAAISHDGQRIAWLTHDENESRLSLSELVSGKSSILISKKGFICVPSWSPDNTHIAYYYGPANVISHDGYSLVIIETKKIRPRENQVAPPSLWTRLSPGRTSPPQWSPDGSMILFEGRYDDNKPWTLRYLVIIKGQNLRKVAGDAWSQDSKHLFTRKMTDNCVTEQQFRLGRLAIFSNEVKMDVWQTSLPEKCLAYSWADDGRHIVFSTFDNKYYLMETKTGRQRKFFQCDGPCKFYWLSETSVSAGNVQGWLLFVLPALVVLVVVLLIIRFGQWGKGLSGRDTPR